MDLGASSNFESQAQVQMLSESLFKRRLQRLEGQEHFRHLLAPELIVGQQRRVSGREKGSRTREMTIYILYHDMR